MLSAGFVLAAVETASAQAWDSPSFLPPRPASELGASLIVPDGADWGVIGYWRQPNMFNMGVRAGFVDTNGDNRWLLGSEFFGMLRQAGPGMPVDLAWTAGIGGTFGDGATEIRVPLGVSAGLSVPIGQALTVYPYAHPRLGIDVDFGGDDTTSRTGLALDIGADLGLGENFMIRFGGTLLDRPAWGIGVSWVRDRPVAVVGN